MVLLAGDMEELAPLVCVVLVVAGGEGGGVEVAIRLFRGGSAVDELEDERSSGYDAGASR